MAGGLFFRRLRALLGRSRLDAQLREELAQHLAARTKALVDDGVPIDEARRRAAVAIGNQTRLREESRDLWGFPTLDSVLQDTRYGLRQLRRTPLFASATILTLALTIGATTALFAIANAVIFRPLPYRQPDRLVVATIESDGRRIGRFDEGTAQLAMRTGTRMLESVAVYGTSGANLTGGAHPDRVNGATVSGRFFEVLGVQPILGRTFLPDEEGRGGPAALLLSHALWDRLFGRAPDVLDRIVQLDDVSYRVVGVMPSGFSFPGAAAFWRPWLPRCTGSATCYTDFLGRLGADATHETARDELIAIRRANEKEISARALASTIHVVPMHDALRGEFRRPLMLLLGIVACVLLIACANVANLLLARTAERRRELGLRTALGARRMRLIRQMLIESVLLALFGAIPGLAIAAGGVQAFLAFGPPELARLPGIGIDATVVLFTLALTLGTGLLFGVAPAIAAGRADPEGWIKGSAAGVARGRTRPTRLLVVLELAAAVVLTIGAGLLAKSFVNYSTTERGFRADNVLVATVPLPLPRYRDAIARREFSDRVLDRLRRLPSIESVTHSQSGLTAIVMTIALPAQLTAGGRRSDEESFGVSFVGADHFRTFGIPIVAGTDCPPPAVERRAVLSESFARLMFPAQSPVGQTIDIAGAGRHTIVGVAGNVRALRTNTSGMPQVYVCAGAANAPARGVIAIRARNGVDPLALAPALRDAVRAADPMQPVVEVKTVPQFVGEAVVTRWFEGGLIVSLAAIAVVLATFGLYAVVAYLVAQRTHEIGVRMALGARRADVLGLVLREGGTITALGLALGVLAALPLVRLVRSMLFDVQPLDVATFAAGVILLSAVALAATCVPALRASRVDPLIALRAE